MDSWRWWSQPSDWRWWASLLATALLSALVVWLSLVYANRRNLVDRPGPRRSHTQTTARGGGIGIVLAILAMGWLPLMLSSRAWPWDFGFGLGGAICFCLVAGIGWIDDHRPLAARVRILVHFTAALLFLLWPILLSLSGGGSVHQLWDSNSAVALACGFAVIAMLAVAMVWSINLHNFMDGINGLLAGQCLFVFSALAALCLPSDAELARWYLVFAAATLGFLPFNFPRARIFMGDVGSGALGFLVAISTLLALKHGALLAVSALILSSAFVTDATCTLLSRMLRGRRWYTAHREHLYQWLARSGYSHAGVVGLYMSWNLIVVVPVLYLVNRDGGSIEPGISGFLHSPGLIWAALIYIVAGLLWIGGKRWCIRAAKFRSS
jgi:UDP-N-acetylmuramyl pentapeptide phosphotransferase/UDP-N-acetylglucosamine-1-phosphate transferase